MATLWGKVKTGGKAGFDKVYNTVDKLGPPVNKLSNKLGSEAFWPTTLDKESDKAARILKSFCKDGFYTEDEQQPADGPKQKQKVVKKIPTSVIKNAKALAIFTTMRTGLWMSGASGSGVLIARKDDGTWSPPSGILLHTAGLGFMVGIDIYDCVVVINNEKALEAFYNVRCTLGSEISVAAGPVGAGGVLDTELHKRQAPIFTYMKSRGFYAGVQIDGTVIIERTDENERFYGQRIPVKEILNGKAQHPPAEIKRLLETIKAAQGDADIDESILPDEPPPGDFEVDDGHVFGVPDREDPDPYGLLALEKEGMVVREAGTHERASWQQFSFNPSPSSPIHTIFSRGSTDRPNSTISRRSSWRTSTLSNATPSLAAPRPPSSIRNSTDNPRPSTMTDSSTQTDFAPEPASPRASAGSSRRSSKASGRRASASPMQEVPEHEVLPSSTPDREHQDFRPVHSANGHLTPPSTPPLSHPAGTTTKSTSPISSHGLPPLKNDTIAHAEAGASDTEDDADDAIEEPVIQQIQTVQPVSQKPQAVSLNKARLVTVPKRVAPKLPPRNPNRGEGRGPVVIGGSPTTDFSVRSPGSSEAGSRPVSPAKDSLDGGIGKGMEEVRLDDEDRTPGVEKVGDEVGEVKIEGWAKASEIRESQEKKRSEEKRRESAMPGGFDWGN